MKELAFLNVCEDCFGISLYDLSEVPDFETLAQIIYIRILDEEPEECRQQQAMYHLKQALIKFNTQEVAEISPETRLLDIAPEVFWLTEWNRLQKETSATTWPDFSRPLWLTTAIIIISAILANELGASFRHYLTGFIFFFITAFGTLLFATTSQKTKLPHHIKTVADFLPYAETSHQIAWDLQQVITNLQSLI